MWRGTFVTAVCLLLGSGLILAQGRDSSAKRSNENRESSPARQAEMSSSNDTRIDLSPPKNDAKDHPNSGAAMMDTKEQAPPSDTQEMHPWDPHRAAKDVEVGDYYFKVKDYRGAMWRYQDALLYKPNDAVATFRLAQCEEKTNKPADAAQHYEAYLKILPEGPFAEEAKKALEHLKATDKK